MPLTNKEVFDLADSVFIAKPTNVELYSPSFSEKIDRVRSEFKIIKVFKGDPKKIQYLEGMTRKGFENSGCLVPLLFPGEFYLIYASNSPTHYLGPCGKSTHIDMIQNKSIENVEPYEGYNSK